MASLLAVPAPIKRGRIELFRRMTTDEFFEFCAGYPDNRLEMTAKGEIIIMPPAGGETGYQNHDLTTQLGNWAKRDGRGITFDSSAGFVLPNGAVRSPDAAWVDRGRMSPIPRPLRKKFLSFCPEFGVELTSPSDRLAKLQKKMQEWIDNGARLGWLIDTDDRTVYVYKPGMKIQKLSGKKEIHGEPPVKGFTLDLTEIWDPNW
jgi:Uma2 family endonuclease